MDHLTELTEIARRVSAAGGSSDEAAAAVLTRTTSPVLAIMAMREGAGVGLGDAKGVVHRNLPADVRAAAEQLWADLLAELDASPPVDQ